MSSNNYLLQFNLKLYGARGTCTESFDAALVRYNV